MKVNLLCKFFGHIGTWNYVADNSCEQVRVCKIDGYQESRTAPHQWISSTSSHEEEVKVPHRKGGGYMGSIYKTTIYECQRCGKVEQEVKVEQMRGNYRPP